MEPEGSLPHSQVPATCPYPEPARSSPYPHILLPRDHPGSVIKLKWKQTVSGFSEIQSCVFLFLFLPGQYVSVNRPSSGNLYRTYNKVYVVHIAFTASHITWMFCKDDLTIVNWMKHAVKVKVNIRTHTVLFPWNLKLLVFFYIKTAVTVQFWE